MAKCDKSNVKDRAVQIVSGIVSFLIVIAICRGCENKKTSGDIITTGTSSFLYTDDDYTESHDDFQSTTGMNDFQFTTGTNDFQSTTKMDVTDSTTRPSSEQMTEFVNQNVYDVMVQARDNFASLLEDRNSVIEEQFFNKDNSSDSQLRSLYIDICNYILCYNEERFDECCEYAKSILDRYPLFYNDYIYQMLVGSHLEEKYQSKIARDECGNALHSNGNICLENGEQIRFIGGLDEVVGEIIHCDSLSKLKWIASIPSLLCDQYSQFHNLEDDGVCYIINETKIKKLCDSEENYILSTGAGEYDFDQTKTAIKPLDEWFIFEDETGCIYGILSYEQGHSYQKINEVRKGIASKSGDALLLDSYVSDLYQQETNYTYHK